MPVVDQRGQELDRYRRDPEHFGPHGRLSCRRNLPATERPNTYAGRRARGSPRLASHVRDARCTSRSQQSAVSEWISHFLQRPNDRGSRTSCPKILCPGRLTAKVQGLMPLLLNHAGRFSAVRWLRVLLVSIARCERLSSIVWTAKPLSAGSPRADANAPPLPAIMERLAGPYSLGAPRHEAA